MFELLEVILFFYLYIDYFVDLLSYVKGGYFIDCEKDLIIMGLEGNDIMLFINVYVLLLIGKNGVFKYLFFYIIEG